jgi:hypothetical protein
MTAAVLRLLPFAFWQSADATTTTYHITRATLTHAISNGWSDSQLWALLKRQAGPIPPAWRADLNHPPSTIRIDHSAVILADDPEVLDRAARVRNVRHYLKVRLAPGIALAHPEHVPGLVRALERLDIATHDSAGAEHPGDQGSGIRGRNKLRLPTPNPRSQTPDKTPEPRSPIPDLSASECATLLLACTFYRQHAPDNAPLVPHDQLEARLRACLTPALRDAVDEAIHDLQSGVGDQGAIGGLGSGVGDQDTIQPVLADPRPPIPDPQSAPPSFWSNFRAPPEPAGLAPALTNGECRMENAEVYTQTDHTPLASAHGLANGTDENPDSPDETILHSPLSIVHSHRNGHEALSSYQLVAAARDHVHPRPPVVQAAAPRPHPEPPADALPPGCTVHVRFEEGITVITRPDGTTMTTGIGDLSGGRGSGAGDPEASIENHGVGETTLADPQPPTPDPQADPQPPTPDPHHLTLLRRGIRHRHTLTITYTDAQHETTTRIIRPIVLHAHGSTWYVRAYCALRGGERTFRVDRITAMQIIGRRPRRGDPEARRWQRERDQQGTPQPVPLTRLRPRRSPVPPRAPYPGRAPPGRMRVWVEA